MFMLFDAPISALEKKVCLFNGLILLLVSTIVLWGWFSHSLILVRVMDIGAPMRVNTALTFMFLGWAEVMRSISRLKPARVFLALVFLSGAVNLFQHITGLNLGIDEFFIVDWTGAHTAGRMSPETSLCFMLTAVTFFAITMKKQVMAIEITCLSIIAALALATYILYNFSALRINARMAFHTAGLFLLISILTLGARWRMLRSTYKLSWLPIIMAISFSSLVILLWVGFWSEQKISISVLSGGLILLLLLGITTHLWMRVKYEKELLVQKQVLEQQQQQLMQQIVEFSPIAIILVNQLGEITMVNAQLIKLFGYSREELLGEKVEKLVPQVFRKNHIHLRESFTSAPTARAMNAGRDVYGLHKEGAQVAIEVSLNRIHMPTGIAVLATIFDIRERKRESERIAASLQEKEVLLKEVYHRVKNNLQLIQSLLNLQQRTLQDDRSKDAWKDTAARVRAMALVHEKLYQSGNLAVISLSEYIDDLFKQICTASDVKQRNIEIHTELADMKIGVDLAIPLGLLLTELLSNSLKHAFMLEKSGHIWVSLECLEEDLNKKVRLIVKDNGKGLPMDFSFEGQLSMGLKLVASLARQLEGTLAWKSEQGAIITLEFPVLVNNGLVMMLNA